MEEKDHPFKYCQIIDLYNYEILEAQDTNLCMGGILLTGPDQGWGGGDGGGSSQGEEPRMVGWLDPTPD